MRDHKHYLNRAAERRERRERTFIIIAMIAAIIAAASFWLTEVSLQIPANTANHTPTVYLSYPDRECKGVHPDTYTCATLPERYTIIWVSPNWEPRKF